MPMSWHDAMVLSVLVCCVPLQYWISQHTSVTQDQRTAEVQKLVNQVHALANKWLSTKAWREWLVGIQQQYMATDYSHWYILDDDDPSGECPAVEVWDYRNPEGSFGMSPRPRILRPLNVKWRVGQVVKHSIWGYRGVIIGWDHRAKAPEEWIRKMHQDNKHWRDQPNYALLVNTDDRQSPQITYVPQENIAPIINYEISHPELNLYFDSYDGAQYVPRPWLRAVYPMD